MRQANLSDAIALLQVAAEKGTWGHQRMDVLLEAAQVFINAARRTDRVPSCAATEVNEPITEHEPSRLEVRHNTTPAELHAMVRDLFLWMHDKGIKNVRIARDGMKAVVTVDGKPTA